MEILHGTQISRQVKLGVGVYFPHGDAHIHGETTIGDCVIVGVHSGIGLRGSFFGDSMSTRGPTIGAYTRVGTGAKVLGSITVGERAVIGAGAVVIEDVPEAATVVGVPAKVVRQGPVGDELPAALERMQRLMEMAQAEGREQSKTATPKPAAPSATRAATPRSSCRPGSRTNETRAVVPSVTGGRPSSPPRSTMPRCSASTSYTCTVR